MNYRDMYIMSEVAMALCRNINDNYVSVSFEYVDDGSIQSKIVLKSCSSKEEEYIQDFMNELDWGQDDPYFRDVIVVVGNDAPLRHVVYQMNE